MPVVDWVYTLHPALGEYIEIHGWPPFPTLEEEVEEDEDINDSDDSERIQTP